jgi:hypothetical protein
MPRFYDQDADATAPRPTWQTLGHDRQHAETEILPAYQASGPNHRPRLAQPSPFPAGHGQHANPVIARNPGLQRVAFWSVFWAVLAAILAAIIITVTVGALLTGLILHNLFTNNDPANALGHSITNLV